MRGVMQSERPELAVPCRFSDVVAVPPLPKQNDRHASYPLGGPIWPDFEKQNDARFCRFGSVFDEKPPQPLQTPKAIGEPAFWGGFVRPHFGHLVAEHLTRLLSYRRSGKRWPVYFMTSHEIDETEVPEYFYDLCAWYGVSRDRIRFLTEPLEFDELWVAPQAEQLRNQAPAPGYVDALTHMSRRSPITPTNSELLFVTRAGLAAKGLDNFAGERYLVNQLEMAGALVLDPANSSIKEQIEAYAGALHLVFAEGSAVHGRQLLGRVKQRISVLQRRPGKYIAKKALRPRVRKLDYHNCVTDVACMQRGPERRMLFSGLTFLDETDLLETFRDFGIDLTVSWSNSDFRKSVEQDALSWLMSLRANRLFYGFWSRLGTVPYVLARNGLEHILDEMAASEVNSDIAEKHLAEARLEAKALGQSHMVRAAHGGARVS